MKTAEAFTGGVLLGIAAGIFICIFIGWAIVTAPTPPKTQVLYNHPTPSRRPTIPPTHGPYLQIIPDPKAEEFNI